MYSDDKIIPEVHENEYGSAQSENESENENNSANENDADSNQGKKRTKEKSNVVEFLEAVVIAVILAAVIRIFLFEPFYIPSSSMEDTLLIGDRIIVNKFIYDIKEPERGDIVVFQFPLDTSRDFVKRLVALGGDTVEIRDNQLYINSEPVTEDYLADDLVMQDYGPIEVPEGNYFVMGDNRNNSDDSRYWGFLAEDLVVGRTDVIYWPLDRMQLLGDK